MARPQHAQPMMQTLCRPESRSPAEALADAATADECRAAVLYAMQGMRKETLQELARTVAAVLRWEERQREKGAEHDHDRAPDTLRSQR